MLVFVKGLIFMARPYCLKFGENGQPGTDVGGSMVQLFNNGLNDVAAGVQRAAAYECCLVLPAPALTKEPTGKSQRD